MKLSKNQNYLENELSYLKETRNKKYLYKIIFQNKNFYINSEPKLFF